MGKIKAIIYYIYFVLSVFIVIFFMAIKNSSHRHFRRIWAKFQRYFLRYKIEIIGAPDKNANMVILNHQSIIDIVVMEEIHKANLSWIAKKEIAKIPIIGKIITLPKMIAIDRSNPRDLVRVLHEVKDRIENNRVIAMFPEGTRRKGDKLLKFQTGAKVITEKLALKVQPIVLLGTREILDSHNFCANFFGNVKVVYLPLVDTTDKDWLEKTRSKMQEILDENLHEDSNELPDASENLNETKTDKISEK